MDALRQCMICSQDFQFTVNCIRPLHDDDTKLVAAAGEMDEKT